ncbi:MAG: LysR family transcriptional regulator [Halopseudomonas sabulinigri]
MNQLEDMQLFVSVLEFGSFTAAAGELGLSKQFVSRRVAALEARLGVRLINRSTRKLNATVLGQSYFERARRILQDVAETDMLVSEQGASPRGALRLSAPMSFGTLHLSTLLPDFMRLYPDVSIELDLSDRTVDLLGEGYDMAIRIGALADSTLIARQLAAMDMVTCASPAYLEAHPAPQTPADLRQHECMLYGHSKTVEWRYWIDGRSQAVAVQGRYRVNNGELVRDAAIAGLGLTMLPAFIVSEALARGDLATVLNSYQLPTTKVYAVYPQHRQSSLLVQGLVDYLRDALLARK